MRWTVVLLRFICREISVNVGGEPASDILLRSDKPLDKDLRKSFSVSIVPPRGIRYRFVSGVFLSPSVENVKKKSVLWFEKANPYRCGESPLEILEKVDPKLLKFVTDGRAFALEDGALPKKFKLLIAVALGVSEEAVDGVRNPY